jgi:hypothetical protein
MMGGLIQLLCLMAVLPYTSGFSPMLNRFGKLQSNVSDNKYHCFKILTFLLKTV